MPDPAEIRIKKGAYQEIYPKVQEIVEDFMRQSRRTFERTRVLDAAAGAGYFSSWLIRQKFQVTPVDRDLDKFQLKEAACQKCDLQARLPFEDQSFDIVVSIETIEHVENPFHLLREFSRVLKPGGLLIVTTPNVHSAKSRIKYLIFGFPNLFEYTPGAGNYDHVMPVNIGQFFYSWDHENMEFVGLWSVANSVKKTVFMKGLLRAITCLTHAVIAFLKKTRRYPSTHYIYRLSPDQIDQLLNEETLVVTATKRERAR